MASEAPDAVSAAGACAEASRCRLAGNEHFKAGRPDRAAESYREALLALSRPAESEAAAEEAAAIGQAVRLNLAACLLESSPAEAVRLCDEVLERDVGCVKALFRRGAARSAGARSLSPGARREELLLARQDLLQAAKLEPGDRQIRAALEEVTEAVRGGGGGGGGGSKLGLLSGLYSDRDGSSSPPPSPPPVCSVCEREGHAQCGRDYWYTVRADWLQLPVEQVSQDPPASFELDGELLHTIVADRRARIAADPEGAARYSVEYGEEGLLSDLSDEEQMQLEAVLDSTDRPYPQPLRPLALAQVVRCALDQWLDE